MPKFIRTAADFGSKVAFGETTESTTLEFKENCSERQIPKGVEDRERKRREGAKELARDITQFANTDGGCLLIGVAEGQRDDGVRVAHALASVDDIEGLTQWVEQAITEFVVPSTISLDIQSVKVDGGSVLAVNVPASPTIVALWDRQTHAIEYLRRTSRGKAWMNPDEMERHMMNGSRAAYLKLSDLVALCQSKEVILTDSIWVEVPGQRELRTKPTGTVRIATVDAGSFILYVPIGHRTQSVNIPYGVVEHAWLDGNGKINLIMSVRLFTTTEGGDLELKALR